MIVNLIAWTNYHNSDTQGCPEDIIEFAGRLCYGSKKADTPEDMGRFICTRIKQGHESIIEHASATFYIEGISRVCLSQLTRHRLASYSVRSQRYCNTAEDGMVFPLSTRLSEKDMTMLQKKFAGMYNTLVNDFKIPKEDARYLLPMGWKTSLVMTANFREWRHFIRMRCDKAAQWEIRELALEILKQLYYIAPSVFEDLHEEFVGKE